MYRVALSSAFFLSVFLLLSTATYATWNCTDSDGGKNYNTAGYILTNDPQSSGTIWDQCLIQRPGNSYKEVISNCLPSDGSCYVEEVYCDPNSYAGYAYDVAPCSNGCNNRACVSSPPSTTTTATTTTTSTTATQSTSSTNFTRSCVETDCGWDWFTKGSITITGSGTEDGVYTDYCLGYENRLREYRCNKDENGNLLSIALQWGNIICQNGCNDGACIFGPLWDTGLSWCNSGGPVPNPAVTSNPYTYIPSPTQTVTPTPPTTTNTSTTTSAVSTPSQTPTPAPDITTNASTSCVDTDGGINLYVYGETYDKFSIKPFPDVCVGITSLIEHWCENNGVKGATYTCENGCKDGACVQIQKHALPAVINNTTQSAVPESKVTETIEQSKPSAQSPAKPLPSVDKLRLAQSILTIEGLKIKIESLKAKSQSLLAYYTAQNNTEDSQKWSTVVELFNQAIESLNNIKSYITTVKDTATEQNSDEIANRLDNVLLVIDRVIDVMLSG